MNDTDNWSPREAWRQLRLEAEAAEHYPLSYSLYILQTHRDALLEKLLPTLLYLKAVAILDDSLAHWLSTNGHNLSPPYREDLNGRLRYLGDNGLIRDADRLHQIRKRRNALAHEPGVACGWAELREGIASIELCLVSLALSKPTGKLDYFAERSALEDSAEPGIRFTRKLTYGVKEDGRPALEISWNQKIHEG